MHEIPGLVAAYLVTPAMNSCLTLVSFCDHCYAVPTVAMSHLTRGLFIQRVKHFRNQTEWSTVYFSTEPWN